MVSADLRLYEGIRLRENPLQPWKNIPVTHVRAKREVKLTERIVEGRHVYKLSPTRQARRDQQVTHGVMLYYVLDALGINTDFTAEPLSENEEFFALWQQHSAPDARGRIGSTKYYTLDLKTGAVGVNGDYTGTTIDPDNIPNIFLQTHGNSFTPLHGSAMGDGYLSSSRDVASGPMYIVRGPAKGQSHNFAVQSAHEYNQMTLMDIADNMAVPAGTEIV